MLARLRDDLIHDFMEAEAFGVEDCAALNVAFLRLAQSPYFEGGNDQLTLVRATNLFWGVLEYRHNQWFNMDPLAPYYDRGILGNDNENVPPRAILLPPGRDMNLPLVPFEGPLPEGVERRAQTVVSRFRARHPEWSFLHATTSASHARRHQLTVEHFEGADALNERLRSLLGPSHDTSLNLDGIRYHHPTWSPNDREKAHRYILAHNGQEVAGLVHYLHRKHDNGLSFISVPPGFRRRGVSRLLYQALMDQCAHDQCLLKRTDPGDFAQANPGITRGYDRLLAAGIVLHTTGHGFLYNALLAALGIHPYARVVEAGKAVCDQACQRRREIGDGAYDGGRADHEDTEAFKARLAALTPARPGPVRRQRRR